MLYPETVEPGTLSLLKKLMEIPSLRPFSLVGGTALSLKYGHRTSVDLDPQRNPGKSKKTNLGKCENGNPAFRQRFSEVIICSRNRAFAVVTTYLFRRFAQQIHI